ncbi:MAG: tetratricopeptide repeat protein [Chloroflexi bacterium]|nr:tetratricopeptide repeat protein [Chloroflexota bacterium]
MRSTAQRIAAYIPATLAQEIMHAGLPTPGQPRLLQAATLFSDISGFTVMSEELASDGPRGAEELNRVLLTTFTAMIDVIHDLGGAVSHFYGDAMSVYFPALVGEMAAREAALRALVCAQMMQQLMRASFGRAVTNRPPGKNPVFPLTIKIGVAYGRCQEMIVGDPAESLEFVLTGTAVDAAAAAEKMAQSGQVVASREIIALAGLPQLCANEPFCLLDGRLPLSIPSPKPILDWSTYDDAQIARLSETARAFIPPTLTERLLHGHTSELAEHRPVTSLFVQFEYINDSDASSDIETDEMAWQMQAYYQWARGVVKRFGSRNARINRILTGDKGNQLHIIFGAPVAPDAPDQAIRCALALLREQPDFIAAQRIGLAAGKVFSGPVGSTTRREYTVVGDVVNVSARLTQVCGPNQALTHPGTVARVHDVFEFEVQPLQQLKGKQQEIAPYRLVGERPSTSQLQIYFGHGERPLIGRNTELDLLLGGMDAALRRGGGVAAVGGVGAVGGVAAIFGAVGVGKTRLLAEGIKHWLAAGGVGVVGVCQQHITDTPYGPWLTIWRDFFNLRPSLDPQSQAEEVVRRTRALVPDCGDDVTLWGEVLRLPIDAPPAIEALSAEVRQARFFALVRRCFQAAAQEKPLLLVLEDAHWADQTSLALLDDLTQALEGHAIFVAVTFRLLEELHLATLERPSCIPIILGDLSATMARRLLRELVGVAALPDAVEQHLGLRDRDGRDSPVSPLFLEESINMMLSAAVLQVNGRVVVDEEKLAQLQIPDTIHGLLLARLDRLSPTSRDLLQVASVIGREFALEPLERIAGDVPRAELDDLLHQLSSEEMTQLVTADPEWIYLFQHALTHEVAYESLPYARRQMLHQAMADWLAARFAANLRPYFTLLAYHYHRAGAHEEGLHYALAAANDARDIFSNKEAVELYRLAEEHLLVLGREARWETAVTLYLSRGECLRFLGDFNAAMQDVEQAIALAETYQDLARLAQAYNLMTDLKYRHGNYDEMQVYAAKVVSELADYIPVDELAYAHRWSGVVATALGNYDLALTHLQRAEILCRQVENRDRLARVLESMAFVYYLQKKLDLALFYMQQSVDLARDFSVPANTASSLSNIALVQFQLGQPESALHTLTEAISIGREASRNFLAHFLINNAEVLCYLGRFAEARMFFDEANDLFNRMDDELGLLELLLVQAYEYHLPLHELESASACLQRAQELITPSSESKPEAKVRLFVGLGQIALEQQNEKAAMNYFEKALKLAEDREIAWWRPAVYYFSGKTLLKLGQRDKAIETLRVGVNAVDTEGCPDYLPLLYLALAEVEPEKKVQHLQNCEATAKKRARFNDRVYCLEVVGSELGKSTSG